MKMSPRQLILASESPRRKDLLLKAGFSFHVFSVKVSESLEKNLTVDEQILKIAERKALASLQAYKPLKDEEFLILAADTMVILDGVPLGKPEDHKQALQYLGLLSGRSHLVKTAVVFMDGSSRDRLNSRRAVETTEVIFRPLSEQEMTEYVDSGEPMDKAGAYGIQGAAGNFVEKIKGPFDNVVGLPIDLVKRLLKEGGWSV
jgi:septum formation protein